MKSLFGFILLSLVLSGPLSWAQETNGIMMVVKGDVKVTGAKDGKTEAAKIGRKVFAGDSITAGPDSRAKIVMSDKNILNISPDSKVVIEKYVNDPKSDTRSVELKVEYGKVRASVEQKYDGEKNKFNIKTPTAVAGVRGTDFITGFNKVSKQSTIITFSGTVAVGTAGPNGSIVNPVFVRPGQQTTVGEGKTPEAPKAMPKEELNNMNKDSSADSAKAGPADQSKQEQPKQDAKKDEPKKEDPKQEVKKEGPTSESSTAKQDQPKQDNAKADQPKGQGGDRGPASVSDAGSSTPSQSANASTNTGSASAGSGSPGPSAAPGTAPPAPGGDVLKVRAGDLPGTGGGMVYTPPAPVPTSFVNPCPSCRIIQVMPTPIPGSGKVKTTITITH